MSKINEHLKARNPFGAVVANRIRNTIKHAIFGKPKKPVKQPKAPKPGKPEKGPAWTVERHRGEWEKLHRAAKVTPHPEKRTEYLATANYHRNKIRELGGSI